VQEHVDVNPWPGVHISCPYYLCLEAFPTRALLYAHAKQTGHRPFACICGKTFSRADALARHCAPKTITCPLCSNHDGDKAFTRLDHLRQHLTTFHRVDKSNLDQYCQPARGNTA